MTLGRSVDDPLARISHPVPADILKNPFLSVPIDGTQLTKDRARTAAEIDPGRRAVEGYSTTQPNIRSPTQTAPAEVAAATEPSLATSYQTGAVDRSGAVTVLPARRARR